MLSRAQQSAPPGHHFYTVQPGDHTSEDVARHAWPDGDPDAGAWLTQYNGIDGTLLRPGQRLIVPDPPPSKAEMERAKRAVYPEEKKLAFERFLARMPQEERERLLRLRHEIDAVYAGRWGDTPTEPITSASEFAAASALNSEVNRKVLARLGLQDAGPDGPVLERLQGPTQDGGAPYRVSPQAKDYLREVFKKLGAQSFPEEDIPIRIRRLAPPFAGGFNEKTHEVNLDIRRWKNVAYEPNYAYELAIIAHEYMHVVQAHLYMKEYPKRSVREEKMLGFDRYRLLPRQLAAQKIDPEDAFDQQAHLALWYVLNDFGAIGPMPAGIRPTTHLWWLPPH